MSRLATSRPAAADTHDAIVVGARVAGAATAMLLARAGLRVLLVDRAPTGGTDTLSTHALMRPGVLQLVRWGVLGEVVAAGTPPVRETTIHYGDEAETIPLKERSGVDALYAPRRTVLDPALVAAAAAAGAEVRYGVAIERLLWSGGRVNGVAGRTADGGTLRAHAPIVIGADGLASTVARQVEAPCTWRGEGSSCFIYGYWPQPRLAGYHFFYRPGATAGVMPTNGGEACVWVGAPTARFLSDLRADLGRAFTSLLAEAAPEVAGELDESTRRSRLRGFPGTPGFLRRPWGPGWALVGDAAAFRDPLSAHGITDALRDAELLARAVIAAASGAVPAAEALADYEARRDAACRQHGEILDRVAAYDWDLPEVRSLLLAASKAMAREAMMLEGLDALPSVAA